MINLQERLAMVLAKLPPQGRGFQADLARACGLKKPSVNGWFNGPTQKIDLENAIPAAAFLKDLGLLGINPKWLSNGDGPMFEESGAFESPRPSGLAVIAPMTPRQTLERLAYFLGESPPEARRHIATSLALFAENPHNRSTIATILSFMEQVQPN